MIAAPSGPTVIHVLAELRASGAEVMLRASSGLWAAAGVRTVVVATGPTPGPYAGELSRAGYDIHHAPPGSARRQLAAVDRVLRDERPAVVHVHTERAGFWYAVLGRRRGIRVVRTVHSVFSFDGTLRAERTVQRALARLAGVDHVAISAAVAANERERFGNPCVIVPNWVDTHRFEPPDAPSRRTARARLGCSSDQLVVASVGNCGPAKNHPVLLHALAALPDTVDWAYLHAGDGSDEEERLAAELGIGARCRFLGQVTDVVPVLQASDVFVMPSTYEGLGNAALEALSTGLRCLLSDVTGLRGVAAVAPADAVRLVPPAVPDLARQLARQLEDVAIGRWPAPDAGACHAAVRHTHGMEDGVHAYLGLYGVGALPG